MLRETVAVVANRTWSESSGNGAECGMRYRMHQHRIPLRAFGESKAKGSGTARVVAKSNLDGLLNTSHCWDFVRWKRVGRPMRTHGTPRHSRREVRRQRVGRVGQSSSSGFKSSREGSAGFPTGIASRRNVSRKVGKAEYACHRAACSKSRRSRSWRTHRICARRAERRV
jgi:hypothetical protein